MRRRALASRLAAVPYRRDLWKGDTKQLAATMVSPRPLCRLARGALNFKMRCLQGKERLSPCAPKHVWPHTAHSLWVAHCSRAAPFSGNVEACGMTLKLKSALLQSVCEGPQSSGSSSGRRVESAQLDLFLMPWKSNGKVKLHIPQLHSNLLTCKAGRETRQHCFTTSQVERCP